MMSVILPVALAGFALGARMRLFSFLLFTPIAALVGLLLSLCFGGSNPFVATALAAAVFQLSAFSTMLLAQPRVGRNAGVKRADAATESGVHLPSAAKGR